MVDKPEGSSPMNCWSRIDKDILESVLERVSLADKLNCRGVCKNWRLIAKTLVADLLSRIAHPPPLLVLEERLERTYRQVPAPVTSGHSTMMKALQMETIRKYCSIPITETIDHLTMKPFQVEETIISRVEESIKGSWFYSLKDDKFLKLNDKCEGLMMSSCAGSTNDWLIFTQDEGSDQTLFLYNPLLDIGIRPSSLSLPVGYQNVILCGDPITNNGYNFSVVVITKESILFARCGDRDWTLLESGCYKDVISCRNHVYALTEACAVQAWDFNRPSPVKILDINPTLKETIVGDLMGEDVSKDWLPRPFFLVESNAEILIVARYSVCVPSPDPRLSHVNASHYCLYKLDLEEVKWVEEKLGNRVIFLGEGQCVSYSAKDFPGYDKGIYCADHQLTCLTVDYREIGEKKRQIELPAFWLVPARVVQNTVI